MDKQAAKGVFHYSSGTRPTFFPFSHASGHPSGCACDADTTSQASSPWANVVIAEGSPQRAQEFARNVRAKKIAMLKGHAREDQQISKQQQSPMPAPQGDDPGDYENPDQDEHAETNQDQHSSHMLRDPGANVLESPAHGLSGQHAPAYSTHAGGSDGHQEDILIQAAEEPNPEMEDDIDMGMEVDNSEGAPFQAPEQGLLQRASAPLLLHLGNGAFVMQDYQPPDLAGNPGACYSTSALVFYIFIPFPATILTCV